MDDKALRESIQDLILLLEQLDKAIPNSIDEELLSFLKNIDSHP